MTRQYMVPLIISVLTFIGVICFSRFIIFVDYILNETVQIIGKIIIEASATLIGFWGVILVFILKSTQSYKEQNETQMYEITSKQVDLLVKKEFETEEEQQKIIELQMEKNKKWLSLLARNVTWANDWMRAMCYWGMGVVGIFIVCIFSSLELMSTSMTASLEVSEFVETLGPSGLQMSFPLMLFAFGISYIFIAILFIAPKKPKQESNS
jgi:hypothetical protein